MIYLTLVVFFIFLLLVWFVVELLFRLQKHDSYLYDSRYLWENYNVKKEDMHYPRKK